MRDKTFELLTQIYSDFSKKFDKIDDKFDKMDDKFGKIDDKFGKIDGRFDSLESEMQSISNTVVRIEVEHGAKLAALFDGFATLTEGQTVMREDITDIKKTVHRLEDKIAVHDLRLNSIETKKKHGWSGLNGWNSDL